MNFAPIAPADARRDLAALDAELANRVGSHHDIERAARTRVILDGLLAFYDKIEALWAGKNPDDDAALLAELRADPPPPKHRSLADLDNCAF